MAKIEVTKMSTKGQVVIPREMREELELHEGEALAVIRKKNILVLKKIESKLVKEEVETLKKIEEAWEDIEKGKFKKATSEEFLAKLKEW